ncbi:CsbD-like protein [Streptococcus infantis SK970]|nr:CsbD-like protein [Streptococcus infantis SK970]
MSTEEKFNQASGSVKEGVGKLIGDKGLESEGAAEKVASKVKEVAEDAKDAIEGAVEGVKNIFKKTTLNNKI